MAVVRSVSIARQPRRRLRRVHARLGSALVVVRGRARRPAPGRQLGRRLHGPRADGPRRPCSARSRSSSAAAGSSSRHLLRAGRRRAARGAPLELTLRRARGRLLRHGRAGRARLRARLRRAIAGEVGSGWESSLADLKKYLEGPRRRRIVIEAGLAGELRSREGVAGRGSREESVVEAANPDLRRLRRHGLGPRVGRREEAGAPLRLPGRDASRRARLDGGRDSPALPRLHARQLLGQHRAPDARAQERGARVRRRVPGRRRGPPLRRAVGARQDAPGVRDPLRARRDEGRAPASTPTSPISS